jgi:hypothetical protein
MSVLGSIVLKKVDFFQHYLPGTDSCTEIIRSFIGTTHRYPLRLNRKD